MKRLVREFEFSDEQLNSVNELAGYFNLTQTTAGILYSRGMDTKEKAEAFLHPSITHLLSPFCMKGMKEAVALITQAREEEWSVAIFGDYDADGIGASAVLCRALRIFGIEPYVFVPERTQGYGMSIKTIDDIFDTCMPDLFITVDCGISNRKEVEYIKEQGAYVIVTDHHELPEELPDCITINPKLKDDYPYDNLCGAGVAFKLAVALIGEKAYALIDYAALSTVADSVPLTHENRDIVAEGLKIIEKNPRPAFRALLGNSQDGVTAQTLSFSVAPRINAAGRMGDTQTALKLFISDDEEEIERLAKKLNEYNAERQRACDALYTQVAQAVRKEGAYSSVVMVAGEKWNAGFVGIVAARIAEEFSRPALLFVKHGDMLRGSARSIENVNIFEALKACSDYIEEFGGHAQAAGINVRAENFEPLKNALNAYISTHYTQESFIPTLTVVGEGEDSKRLARELILLEPFGIGNPRPLFSLSVQALPASPVKALSPHVSFTRNDFNYMYFNGVKDLRLLRDDLDKTLVYEYNLSKFHGREYLKGIVRAVLYEGLTGKDAELDALENALRALSYGNGCDFAHISCEETQRMLDDAWKNCRYGICAVVHDRATLARYNLPSCKVENFRLSSGNVENAVLYAPDYDCDLSAFREILLLDTPAAFPCITGNARVYAGDAKGYNALLSLSTEREALLDIYTAIRAREGLIAGDRDDLAACTRACSALGFRKEQFLFALTVFSELGLVFFREGALRTVRGRKVALTDSKIYAAVLKLQEENL